MENRNFYDMKNSLYIKILLSHYKRRTRDCIDTDTHIRVRVEIWTFSLRNGIVLIETSL